MDGLKKYVIALFCFSFLCFASSCYVESNAEKPIKAVLDSTGGEIGPIDVKQDKSIYEIEIKQSIARDNDWSYVSGEILDEKKEYLFSFGDEFWKESGYDSEGYWSESKTNYDTKITFPKKGIYYIKIDAEKEVSVMSSIDITVSHKKAGALPFFMFAIISLIAAVVLKIYDTVKSVQ